MGFFDSLTDLLGLSNSNAEDAVSRAEFNLGNIFLPGNLQGGQLNTAPRQTGLTGGGFQNSPFSQSDFKALETFYNTNANAARLEDFGQGGIDRLNELGASKEAQDWLRANWSGIHGNLRGRNIGFHGISNWQDMAFNAPAGYDGRVPTAEEAAATPQTSLLGDLEPARAGFAGFAADQIAEAGENNYDNILTNLREQAAPQERSMFNRLNNNLFSRGRLGGEDSVTSEAYRGFARGQSEADLQRQLSAYGLSDQLRTSALGRAVGSAQGASGLTGLSTLPFDLALKLATARSSVGLGQANSAAYQNDSLVDVWSKFWSFGG